MPDRLMAATAPVDESGAGREAADDFRLERPASRAKEPVASRFAPELAQIVVVLLWASTFVMTKAVFAEMSPLAFIFARFVMMVALALA